jgi:hypothetical protein
MSRIVLALLLVAGAASPTLADRKTLSPESAKLYQDPPVIELVTMGIGALIWERHGHIALCVRYADPRQDVCYNYGIAEFHHPLSMTWGFFRQTNSFWVGKIPANQMLDVYRYADRTIWVQPLPLNAEQKKQVLDKLEHDILDENRYYAYDHFEDNCTTRVRDIIDNVTGGSLQSLPDPGDDRTFRDLAREGFFGMRIPLLITDIAMGRSTDRVPSFYEKMFLPQYLREAVQKRWGIEPIVIYERVGPPPLDDGPSGRVLFALFAIAITAPAWATRLWGRFQRTGLAIAIVPPALLGLILWFLAIISPLPYVRTNESCLIFFPFDFLLLFLPVVKRRWYARARVAMLGLVFLLLVVGILKQPLFAPLLWPLIPLAVVGFWPQDARIGQLEKQDAKPDDKTKVAKKSARRG